MEEKTFYDIHLHAFNLSHPYLRAFIRRLNFTTYLALAPLLGWLLPLGARLFKKKIGNAMNLLAVMEDDIDSVFLLLENCLRENGLLDNDGLHINGITYPRVVLTPLMIDFGYKRMRESKNIHYNEPCRKPIRRQVIDVYNAVTYYHNFKYSDRYARGFPHLKPDAQGRETKRIFEIYPFIGINTVNYTEKELEDLLKKYFENYQGSRQLINRMTREFDGNIEHLSSNYAAGIKLYPPLDFDPWPARNDTELNKVRTLYEYCQDRDIPITVHGSEGGFNVVGPRRRKRLTDLRKWDKVLGEFPRLKLNLAHFPVNEKTFFIFPKKARLKQFLALLANPKYENLYVDFSCRATDPCYYKALKKLIAEANPPMKETLSNRIMFGTDFSINLTSIESYNAYYQLFVTAPFSSGDKEKFCSGNPERFLFKH